MISRGLNMLGDKLNAWIFSAEETRKALVNLRSGCLSFLHQIRKIQTRVSAALVVSCPNWSGPIHIVDPRAEPQSASLGRIGRIHQHFQSFPKEGNNLWLGVHCVCGILLS